MNNEATVETQMIIRRPIEVVFQAFIDPSITTQFWFTKSSGPLEEGKTITWEWEMYGASGNVLVKKIIPNKLIATVWGEPSTSVDYTFKKITATKTLVVITNYGFKQTGTALNAALMDNMGGFTTVLAGLKAYLEFGIRLNLVLDKYPNAFNEAD